MFTFSEIKTCTCWDLSPWDDETWRVLNDCPEICWISCVESTTSSPITSEHCQIFTYTHMPQCIGLDGLPLDDDTCGFLKQCPKICWLSRVEHTTSESRCIDAQLHLVVKRFTFQQRALELDRFLRKKTCHAACWLMRKYVIRASPRQTETDVTDEMEKKVSKE